MEVEEKAEEERNRGEDGGGMERTRVVGGEQKQTENRVCCRVPRCYSAVK